VHTRMCKQCYHLFLSPTFTPQEISFLYSKEAGSLMRLFYQRAEERAGVSLGQQAAGSKMLANQYEQESSSFRKQFICEFVTTFSRSPIKRVLDIGGGDGGNILAFKNSEKFVYDLSNHCSSNGEIEFIDDLGKARHLIPFDLLVSTHTLEHVGNLRDMLECYTAMCEPGSLFYVEVPMQYVYVFLKRFLFPILRKGTDIHWHINYFSRASLRALFELSGYKTLYLDSRLMPYGFLRMQVFVALFVYTEKACAGFTSGSQVAREFLSDLMKATGTEAYRRIIGRYPTLRSHTVL
jgi:hypothetical protein